MADRLLKALHRTVGGILPPTLLSRRYARIPGRVHVDDLMLGGRSAADLDHYLDAGTAALEHLDWYGAEFVERAATLRAAGARTGAGFLPYRKKAGASAQSPADGRFGITILTRAWVERTMAEVHPALKLVRLAERGLQRHQDVWAFAGLAAPTAA